jgi:glycosyltransferase involved in cell wall biosynthesis
MRILMVSQFYPPLYGGIERHVHSLSRDLCARGHQVAVATLHHEGLPGFEEVDGIRIYRVHGTLQRFSSLFTTERQHSPPFPDPEVTLALRRIVEKEQPEIIHGHDWLIRSFLPLKRKDGARLVRTLHDCELACAQMRYMFKDSNLCEGPSIKRCMACVSHHYGPVKGLVTLFSNRASSFFEKNAVDVYIPVSHAIADVNQLDDGRSSFQVLPNFVLDNVTAEADQAPETKQLPAAEFILQVGDLVPDKGINILLDAYRQLQSPPPLVLIGRPSEQHPLELPPGVVLIENLAHPSVMDAWRRCMFGTVTSTCLDASPTVTLEAMASGRPVIGSRIGGITDQVVDGETGFLVPSGDVQALRGAMERLIADPALRERMGAAARQQVQKFQASNVVSRIEQVYQQLSSYIVPHN